MGAHVIFFGPSGAGKTSLMLRLAQSQGWSYEFNVDRTWTTRERRPGEGDEENIFVDDKTFEASRPRFLFTFNTYSAAKYGIEQPVPLAEHEVRMRILRPTLARMFARMVPEPVIHCGISPFLLDPGAALLLRDPHMDPREFRARVDAFAAEEHEAREIADIHFHNRWGINDAANALGRMIIGHLSKPGL